MRDLVVQKDLNPLDAFVKSAFVRPDPNFNPAIDFVGDDLESATWARVRVSPLYQSNSGLMGYLEVARTANPFEGGHYFTLLGIVDVPKSAIDRLDVIDPKLKLDFARDYGVDLQNPENLNISPFVGFDLPESTYYLSYHPGTQTGPMPFPPGDENKELRLETYQRAHLILTGYLSKMEQWLHHAAEGKLGKERIPFIGNALLVGRTREPLGIESLELPAIENSSGLKGSE